MAHGSKRWIVVENGRIKRSTDRTVKDRLVRDRQTGRFRIDTSDEPRSQYDRYLDRGEWSLWGGRSRYQAEAGGYEDRTVQDYWRRGNNYSIPTWTGPVENRLYRAQVKAAIRTGRYDDIPRWVKTIWRKYW
jgi:hypothetical protein